MSLTVHPLAPFPGFAPPIEDKIGAALVPGDRFLGMLQWVEVNPSDALGYWNDFPTDFDRAIGFTEDTLIVFSLTLFGEMTTTDRYPLSEIVRVTSEMAERPM